MKDECLICKAPLVYLETDEEMECAICHKKENSKTRCENGHYVCNECHMAGLDTIIGLCRKETSKNPVEIIEKMMALPFCHMHGPEHHVMVGAALLTAYKNAGGEIDLDKALVEMMNRGKSVPGGSCGFWGACGAGISSGMFVSIISSSTPLTVEPFALSHKMTVKSLSAIGDIGGPRCCKRDSFLSILAAIDFVKDEFGVEMERPEIVCTYSSQNNQCIGKRCPFKENSVPSEDRSDKPLSRLDRIKRVGKYERLFDEVLAAMKEDKPEMMNETPDSSNEEKLRMLASYYTSGEWLDDYEADERGEFPPDLKRGVLSQDALYDLLVETNYKPD